MVEEQTELTRIDKVALFLLAMAFLYLAWLPLNLDYQFIISWGLIFFLVIARKFGMENIPFGRLTLMIIVLFVSMRYLIWRTTGTLVYTSLPEFIMLALVFISELEVTAVHLVGVFSNIWPMRRHKGPKLPDDINLLPSVDIYIPTYSEDGRLVAATAKACMLMRYPKEKLNIYILDDGATEQKRASELSSGPAWYRYKRLKGFCEANGIGYLTRERNESAKAGNINAALPKTSGELILVLDCDHVPTSDFLENTVGFFIQNPKLFLVQTPHFFINPDPVEKSLGTFHRAPSENEMFYRATLPGVDMWNSSFFCGSAAVLRRSCLEEVGGLAGLTITEDAEVSIQLHAKGYQSLYLPKPMISGLSPETFGDFILQRSRWCQGMLQMGLLTNPMKISGLSLAQKVCYTSYYLYWFFGFARVMFFIGPCLFILFGWQIYHASTTLVLAYALPHLIGSLIAADILYGKYRWPLFSELYESVQSLFLFRAVLGVINNPRSPTFLVTPKGRQLDHDVLSPLSGPFYILLMIMLISVPVAVYKYHTYPLLQDVVLLCSCWLAMNIIMAMASIGSFWERHQFRRHHRAWAKGPVHLTWDKGRKVAGNLTDLSLQGIGLTIPATDKALEGLEERKDVLAHLTDSYGKKYCIEAKVMRLFQRGENMVCGLLIYESKENYTDRLAIVYGDSQRLADAWQRPSIRPGFFKIMYFFIKLGIRGVKESSIGLIVITKDYCIGFWHWLAKLFRLQKGAS